MHIPLLPQGDSAALLPGASYSVPGLFQFSPLLYECLRQVKEKFSYDIPVKYLYGGLPVRWNCGRLVFERNTTALDDIAAELSQAADRGITPLLTFSMPHMEQEDLHDPLCNDILALLDQVKGGIIVASPLLRDYTREHFPNVEVHASIIMTSFQPHRDLAYYQDLARDYHRYVVHPDDNFRPDLLAQLPKDSAEIILNERCGYQCAQRKEHYESITQDQIALMEGSCALSGFLDRCPFVPERKQAHSKACTISLTTREAQDLAQQGFSLFKLQGRLDIPYTFFFDFLRYTLEGEVAFPSMFPVFSYAIRDYRKERQRKRPR
ncbi:hypothetical protein [Evtepia sp.]|uniref:hypothetical protein n=1 Tax=Evtepia sp. TaxID=2773933 RepID=UPI002A74FC38|nr:hypothetical protein [Evtepia sp.]